MKVCTKIVIFQYLQKKWWTFLLLMRRDIDMIIILYKFLFSRRPLYTLINLISINFDQLIHFQADLPLIKVSFSAHEWNGFSAARSPEHKYPQMQKLKSVFKMIQFFQISLLSASSVTKAEKVVNIRNQLDVSMRMCKFLLVYMCLNFLLSISVCF